MQRYIILAFCLLIPWFSSYAGVEEGLVGYWPFDEGRGKTVKDASGNGNDGKFVGKVEWVDGVYGSALKFDGETGYVAVPDDKSLDLTEALTVMFWFKPSEPLTGRRVMSKNNSYFIMFDFGDPDTIELLVKPRNDFVESKTKEWKIGKWYHFAGIYNKGILRVYINGELEGERKDVPPIAPSDLELWIGADDFGRPTDFFPGAIDEVRIYNRALSAGEIKEAMKGPAPVRAKGKLPIVWASVKVR
ncbi:LamG domain-containing protein [Candidatus Poribacteria bacterium]|nr:LamG domain-containing protein [Candidatus Poribacteria bacterium]